MSGAESDIRCCRCTEDAALRAAGGLRSADPPYKDASKSRRSDSEQVEAHSRKAVGDMPVACLIRREK